MENEILSTSQKVTISGASVKVMRSHDYCHFEVCLSTNTAVTTTEVDALRKEAARLADKAVEQYKIARANQLKIERGESAYESLKYWHDRALETPEGERTPNELAQIKQFKDYKFQSRLRYDYQDDWSEPNDDGEDNF